MASREKVCLTTFIYGVKYQAYIPFLVYSCHKSFPEYDIRLYLYENLNDSIKKQLEIINAQNLTIVERHFADCPKMNPLKAKSLRWVLWDEEFLKYDYLYIIDIDMIYIREPLPLHKQHVIHMGTTGLPYDNLVRHFRRSPLTLTSVLYRVKTAGFSSFLSFLIGPRDDYRVTGLHFVSTKDYFRIMNVDNCEKYRKLIYNGRFVSLCLSSNNESFLYSILSKEGLRPELLPIQTESYKMLDFNNPERKEFRPHHGIHLGIFRQDLQSEGKRKSILDHEVYLYYIDIFKRDYLTDPVFLNLIRNSAEDIKRQFDNLCRYYHILQPSSF